MTRDRIRNLTAISLVLCAGTAWAAEDSKAQDTKSTEPTVAAADARSTAQTSGSTTRDLESGVVLQRLVISKPDGTREIRWVPRPAPRTAAPEGGRVRLSLPGDSNGLGGVNLPGRDAFGNIGRTGGDEAGSGILIPDPQLAGNGPLGRASDFQPITPNKGGQNPGGQDQGPAASTDAPVLVPGNGFPREEGPANRVGNPSQDGFTAQAIARWNVVPYQDVTEQFQVGVVAFHLAGIDRVEFSLNGGPWQVVHDLSLNTRTETWEYVATVDPALVPEDGLVELRARVVPNVGEERVLSGPLLGDKARDGEHAMFLNLNDGGTLPQRVRYVDARNGSDVMGDGTAANPYNTVAHAMASVQSEGDRNDPICDGAIIYCMPGHYVWGPQSSPGARTLERWMTVTSAPGVDRSQVIFDRSASGGFRTELIKLANVTVSGDVELRSSRPAAGFKMLWLDNVVMNGPGRTEPMAAIYGPGWNAIYVIDSTISDYKDAVKFGSIVRNSHAINLGSDAFGMTGLVVNSSVRGINGAGTTFHPDVYQIQRGIGADEHVENLITYNFKAYDLRAQGIFSRGVDLVEDVAFVNVLMERDVPEDVDRGGMSCQWMAEQTNHLLMWNVSLPGYGFSWRTAGLDNLSIRGCLFDRMIVRDQYTDAVRPEWFENNHYMDTESFGTVALGSNATFGDPGFVNPAANDFRPRSGSILASRMQTPLMPVDAVNLRHNGNASVGALSAAD